jgi:hypothetical protein
MSVKPLRAIAQKSAPIDAPIVGWICGYDPAQGLLVDFPQSLAPGPLAARWTMQIDQAAVDQAVRDKQPAVLIFEQGDPLRPLVIGLLQPTQLPKSSPAALSPAAPLTEARIDGKRLTFEAEDEIVLRCGPASVTLRRNGAIIIRGAQLVSHASGQNRIRGGSVAIN